MKRDSQEWKDEQKRARGRIYKRLKRVKKPFDIKQHDVEHEMFVSLKATHTSHIPRQFLNKWNKEPYHDLPPLPT